MVVSVIEIEGAETHAARLLYCDWILDSARRDPGFDACRTDWPRYRAANLRRLPVIGATTVAKDIHFRKGRPIFNLRARQFVRLALFEMCVFGEEVRCS